MFPQRGLDKLRITTSHVICKCMDNNNITFCFCLFVCLFICLFHPCISENQLVGFNIAKEIQESLIAGGAEAVTRN